ncbi:hypothetical protein H072_10910 [Dactylellina haptotyla CBS 200.50]|uniref:Uncharacterized protein n=1 Tax=Dactylellina haptotyla (strain CBS 200.50) TaxID=1284197 RepID=S8A3A6_DACHA|nr:hypothetical protein H072_10910 [Dactylellina haptotyla CBS 200.50]
MPCSKNGVNSSPPPEEHFYSSSEDEDDGDDGDDFLDFYDIQHANQNARTLVSAIWYRNPEAVKEHLSTGISPNVRLYEPTVSDGVLEDWHSDPNMPPRFRYGWADRERYPLSIAAGEHTHPSAQERKLKIGEMMTELIERGADLYAVYRQPLMHTKLRGVFPGHQVPDSPPEAYGFDHWVSDRHMFEEKYGLRCVVHAILEDSNYVLPILNDNMELDLEHRDPRGLTLLLCASRSVLGPDAAINSTRSDSLQEGSVYLHNPFADVQMTAFQYLLNRGANLLAIDDLGRNLLHHLLDQSDTKPQYLPPPVIQNTLRHVLSLNEGRELINKPDNFGTYPLHAALQRLRRNYNHNYYLRDDTTIDDLLAAGAQPHTADGRGNIALHYLADDGLVDSEASANKRRLFQIFLGHGLDINTRNSEGHTPLSLFLGAVPLGINSWYDEPNISDRIELDKSVLDMFDEAGVNWSEIDDNGRTYLHTVVLNEDQRSKTRYEYLKSKGVDEDIRDSAGKSAFQIQNPRLYEALRRLALEKGTPMKG